MTIIEEKESMEDIPLEETAAVPNMEDLQEAPIFSNVQLGGAGDEKLGRRYFLFLNAHVLLECTSSVFLHAQRT